MNFINLMNNTSFEIMETCYKQNCEVDFNNPCMNNYNILQKTNIIFLIITILASALHIFNNNIFNLLQCNVPYIIFRVFACFLVKTSYIIICTDFLKEMFYNDTVQFLQERMNITQI